MQSNPNLDPVFENERNTGVTPPEDAAASSNLVGRPRDAAETGGFHEPAESAAVEREPLSTDEAIKEGGSFDGLGVPVADDLP